MVCIGVQTVPGVTLYQCHLQLNNFTYKNCFFLPQILPFCMQIISMGNMCHIQNQLSAFVNLICTFLMSKCHFSRICKYQKGIAFSSKCTFWIYFGTYSENRFEIHSLLNWHWEDGFQQIHYSLFLFCIMYKSEPHWDICLSILIDPSNLHFGSVIT